MYISKHHELPGTRAAHDLIETIRSVPGSCPAMMDLLPTICHFFWTGRAAWYPGKREHGKVVPTWNYEVAHVHGVARAIHDEGWLRDLLVRLTADHEAARPMPWAITDAPSEFIDRLLRAVVGIEIPIDGLVGKRKASQEEELQDRWGTVEGLTAEGDDNALAMASLVRNAIGRSERG
jgi:transcriptional regulator